jgi:DNA-binding NarL/FixJ family response regulator
MAKSISDSMIHRPRVLLADDHTMLLDAFRRLLEPECEIVGTASDGRALIELAVKTNPEIVILDIAMPCLNGIEAAAQIRRKLPAVKIIFLTVNQDPDVAAEAIRRGASAFLLKSSASSELISAIRLTLDGKTYITPLITKGKPLGVFLEGANRPTADKLTARQREVLQLLAEGKQMKEAAAILNLTPRTIAFHKYEIMEHLGLKTGAELVQYAVEHHIVSPRA